VDASPPGALYTGLKFAQRNRIAISFVVVVITVLSIGLVSTAIFAMRSVRAEKLAENETRISQVELARATEIKALLTEMLLSISPEVAQGRDTTILRMILEGTAKRIEQGEIE